MLDFIFRLVLCNCEDVSFNIICLDVLKDIKQIYSSTWFKKYRLETLFKGDNVQALIKTSNSENFVPSFLKESSAKSSIYCAFLVFSTQTGD